MITEHVGEKENVVLGYSNVQLHVVKNIIVILTQNVGTQSFVIFDLKNDHHIIFWNSLKG